MMATPAIRKLPAFISLHSNILAVNHNVLREKGLELLDPKPHNSTVWFIPLSTKLEKNYHQEVSFLSRVPT